MRKMISFKIENLPEKQRQIVDDWANGQVNIQQSLANIIMHIVEFTGNDDVMDFDIQRKLHKIFIKAENGIPAQKKEESLNTIMTIKTVPQPKKVESEDDYPDGSDMFDD